MRLLKRFLLIVLALIAITANGCTRKEKSDKEVVDYFKSIENYKSKATITITNDRQNITYDCNIYYDSKKGARLELGADRIYLYKGDSIEIQDLVNKRTYTQEQDFDNLYYLTFINEYIKLMYVNEDTKYYIEENDNRRYQLIELTIPHNNRNMAKAVLYVDTKSLVPEKILIYDNKDKERIRFNYSNFAANEKLDEKLFSFQ